ncbi:hypothetical protein AK51_10170 [Serratia nematodiphila DZ0503SBS1]|nr:hypothetical protein AK51_10170 [Serratia nematodiphila DZ0503SBS1]
MTATNSPRRGARWPRWGCDPRLAAMLVAGATLSADGLATAALLAALLEEPPRGGQMDIGYWLSRPQANWRQRAAQLAKRLPQRAGQVDASWRRACWRRHLPIASPSAVARTAATCWLTAWGRR